MAATAALRLARENARLEGENAGLAQENARLARENARLRRSHDDLAASAATWIHLYEAALARLRHLEAREAEEAR